MSSGLHIARDDGLQRRRDVARHDHRIDPGLGAGAVRAAAGDGDIEVGAARHHRAGADLKFADCEPRPVVHAKDRVARKALEQPVLDHRLAAAEPFLGGLEDQVDGPVEIAGLGEIPGCAEQHRRVPVMAAGVHATLMARAVGQVGRLLDRQRVHVGPQPDRARRRAGAQPADDTRAADAAMHLVAELGELLCDEIGGPLLLEAEFGMSMDVAPPTRQVVVKFRNALNDPHRRSPLSGIWTPEAVSPSAPRPATAVEGGKSGATAPPLCEPIAGRPIPA